MSDNNDLTSAATLFVNMQMEDVLNYRRDKRGVALRVINDYRASQEYPRAIESYDGSIVRSQRQWLDSLSLAFSNLRVSTEKYIEENPLDSLGELTHEEKEIFQQVDKVDRLLDVNSESTPEESEMFQLLDKMDKLLDNSHATKEDENSFGTGMGMMANRM